MSTPSLATRRSSAAAAPGRFSTGVTTTRRPWSLRPWSPWRRSRCASSTSPASRSRSTTSSGPGLEPATTRRTSRPTSSRSRRTRQGARRSKGRGSRTSGRGRGASRVGITRSRARSPLTRNRSSCWRRPSVSPDGSSTRMDSRSRAQGCRRSPIPERSRVTSLRAAGFQPLDSLSSSPAPTGSSRSTPCQRIRRLRSPYTRTVSENLDVRCLRSTPSTSS
jgi:hypothetical protein